MQRVRIGLTGLCSVFLLVLLAAAIFGLAPKEPSARKAAASPAAGNVATEDPKDPLAELGVTPGGSPSGPAPEQAAQEEAAPAPAASPAASPPAAPPPAAAKSAP